MKWNIKSITKTIKVDLVIEIKAFKSITKTIIVDLVIEIKYAG